MKKFVDLYLVVALFGQGVLLISVIVHSTDINMHQINISTLPWFFVLDTLSVITVFHLLDDSSGFVFAIHFLMSESLPYSPPIRT